MLSYPINFFIRDSFVLEEYLYSSYKKNFYLIKNTKLTAFLVETNNLLNGILSYFFFFFLSPLSSIRYSTRVIFFLRDIQYKSIPREIKKKILKFGIRKEFERKLTEILWIF